LEYYRRNQLVLWIATFLAAASYQQVIPFLSLFLSELGVTSNLTLWANIVFASHYASAIFFQPFWGRIADRVGRKPMMIRAGICLGLIYILMSFATQAWHVAFCRLLNGALTGFIPSATSLCATNTPKQYAARYVASLQTANAAGTIIGPAIGGVMAELFGFRGALKASGFTVLACTLLVLFFVVEKNRVSIQHKSSMWQDAVHTVRSPLLLSVMLTVAFTSFGTSAVQPILALYLTQLGQGSAKWLSGVIFSLPGVAFVLTAALWTRLGEKRGFGKIIPFGLIWAGVFSVTLSFSPNALWFAVLYFLMGAFIAILRPSASALIALKVAGDKQGMAYGMQQSAFMLGGLLGPLFVALVGFTGQRWVFAWVGLGLLCGAYILRRLISRWDRPEVEALQQVAVAQD
jgi:DHA1 family multidrug resistance protein-like MFS transporter